MPKKEDDEFILSEYGTWNVASDYSKLKIMRPLALADEYQTIAEFGYLEFEDETQSTYPIDVLRIRGLKRLIKILVLLIDNSKFVIKGKEKENLKGYRKELDRFYKVMSTLSSYKINQIEKTRELKIIPEKYDPALERVIEIKSLINEPLNKFDLIFTHKEEFDPKKAKKQLKEKLEKTG